MVFLQASPPMLLYGGKLSRGKTLANFEVLWLFAKVFSTKFRGVVSFGGTIEQTEINFSTKISFPPIHENFLP